MAGNDSLGRVAIVMLPPGVQYPLIVLNIAILIFGGLSSILTALLVLRYPTFQRQFTYTLIAHQSIIDAIYLLLLLPMRLNTIVKLAPNEINFCALERYCAHWLVNSSSLCILFMAVSRYIQIVHPKFYPKFNKRWVHIGVLLYIWLAPFLVQLIGIVSQPHPNVVFDYVRMGCTPTQEDVNSIISTINLYLFYVPEQLVTIYCYIHIIVKVKMAQRKVTNGGPKSNQRSSKSDKVLTLTTFVIFAVYVIFYTIPGAISNSFENGAQPLATSISAIKETMVRCPPLLYILVYATMNSQMRQGYKMILQCKKGRDIIVEDPKVELTSNTNVTKVTIVQEEKY